MDKSQQELRREAAQAFMKSLDQLEMSMAGPEAPAQPSRMREAPSVEKRMPQAKPAPSANTSSPQGLQENAPFHDMAKEWEDAVADIEQFTKESDE